MNTEPEFCARCLQLDEVCKCYAPTDDTRAQIVAEYLKAFTALQNVCNLADEHGVGGEGWFCDGYPFPLSLDDFVWELHGYIEKMEGGK
jgi:hypothetical protein